MPDYVYSIILVVIIVVVMAWWVSKKKGEVWEGILVKKEYDSGNEDTAGTFRYEFKTNEGKKKKFSTPDRAYFDKWTEGDKAIKKKGEFYPEKA